MEPASVIVVISVKRLREGSREDKANKGQRERVMNSKECISRTYCY